jgi:hypothetical protein
MVLHYTRRLFTQDMKRAFLNELNHGITSQLYAQRQFYPVGGGMNPMSQPWNAPDPFAT